MNRFGKFAKENWFLLVCFLVIAGFRLPLTLRGHFHFQDELRYRYTFSFVREVAQFNFGEGLKQLFEFKLYARPLLVLYNLPTALLQVGLLLVTGIKTETQTSLIIPSVFQVGITMLNGWLVYKLCFRYSHSKFLSLSSLIIYSSLINTNLYIRHILPYDGVLLIYLSYLFYVLNIYKKCPLSLSVVSGVLVATLHLIYPAFYLFGLVIGFFVVFLPKDRWLIRSVLFAVAGVVWFSLFVALGNMFGRSFLGDTKFLISRVVVGSPKETFIFLYRYMWEVEGLAGRVLSVVFTAFLMHFLFFWRSYVYEFRVITTAMVGSYLLHALSGPLLGKVFYGRIIHMYFWFIVLAVIVWINGMLKKWQFIRNCFATFLCVVSMVSLFIWYPKYFRISYPLNESERLVKLYSLSRVASFHTYYPRQSEENKFVVNPQAIAINFGKFFLPSDQPHFAYDIPKNSKLVFKAPHPLNFVGYQFEAHTPLERQRLRERNYQMELYLLK